MDAEKKIVDLTKSSNGGGGGGTSDYTDLSNKPKVNNVTLSGNKTSAQLGLVGDVQVNGTSVTTSGVANIPIAGVSTLGAVRCNTSDVNGVKITNEGVLTVGKASDSDIDARTSVYKPIVPSNLNYAVRSVAPACTTLSGTTATITANTTYSHKLSSSGCVYTISSPSDNTVYSGFILLLDTTNSATIAFQTDGTPSASISISGNPTIETSKKYTVTGQWDIENSIWQLFIISYDA